VIDVVDEDTRWDGLPAAPVPGRRMLVRLREGSDHAFWADVIDDGYRLLVRYHAGSADRSINADMYETWETWGEYKHCNWPGVAHALADAVWNALLAAGGHEVPRAAEAGHGG
jgi:hypothetical protein